MKEKLKNIVRRVSTAPFMLAAIQPPATVSKLNGDFIPTLLCLVASWIFTFAIILSIILILMTAIQYMTAGGDPEKIKVAHRRILYVCIGVAVAIIARTVPVLVSAVIGAGSSGVGSVCS